MNRCPRCNEAIDLDAVTPPPPLDPNIVLGRPRTHWTCRANPRHHGIVRVTFGHRSFV